MFEDLIYRCIKAELTYKDETVDVIVPSEYMHYITICNYIADIIKNRKDVLEYDMNFIEVGAYLVQSYSFVVEDGDGGCYIGSIMAILEKKN